MTADHNNRDNRPKRTWNSSTKLTQPRCPVTTEESGDKQALDAPRRASLGHERSQLQPRKNEMRDRELQAINEQQILTRKLLERAVSTAFDGLLQDSTLDATAFPDERRSQSSKLASMCDKKSIRSPVTEIEAKLRTILTKSTTLSTNHRQRRRDHSESMQQAASTTKVAKEYQRRMHHASFEHRKRKIAVQALQARIQREIEYLVATAADLEKRVNMRKYVKYRSQD